MDNKDKKIAKLERDLMIANHQIIHLKKIRKEYDNYKSTVFAKLKDVFLGKNLTLRDRIILFLKTFPILSSFYVGARDFYLSLFTKTIVNTKHEGTLITAVIVCYNYYQYIDDCVNSVLAQNLGDKLEIIIVEGFSNDGTREKLKERSWPNTRIIFQDHRASIGENRLKGIQEARGKYVSTIDADDKIAPDYFKKAIEILEREYYDVIYPDIGNFEESTTKEFKSEFIYDELFKVNIVASVLAVFRKSFWEENNIGYSESRDIFEDWDFWIRMAKAGARFKHLKGFYHLYRVHTSSSASVTDTRLADQIKKDEQTKAIYKSFIKTKEYYKSRSRQIQKYKIINPDINLKW